MPSTRPAWAEIDLGAVRSNAEAILAAVGPAQLCAVVKANGYGHGAVAVARAAMEGGATWLAVALVEEGVQLRRAGIDAPVLLLSEPRASAFEEVAAAHLVPAVYTEAGLRAASEAGLARGVPLAVHLKVDTGMHRVGATADDALSLAKLAVDLGGVDLEGVWTHLAVSEDLQRSPYTALQLRRFDDVVDRLAQAGIRPKLLHAANSGGALGHPASRYDMVRCGIAMYGYAPGRELAKTARLAPAMSVKASVTFVKRVAAGERISYGLRYECPADTVIATVPLGYADGVPRRLAAGGGQVLVGGRRRKLAGTVTMDQVMVDCGPDAVVEPGDEVVFIGEQGGERITAEDWATWADTISYEIVCGIGPRVPRRLT